MGLFDKLFGGNESTKKIEEPKDEEDGRLKVSKTNIGGFKVIREFTEKQRDCIEKSTIQLRSGVLYMHYKPAKDEKENRQDQAWRNKVMHFWKAEEKFPQKALPPEFESLEKQYFLFTGDTSQLGMNVAKAIPWFGMPGMGEKHLCGLNGKEISIPELHKLNLVDYIELVELKEDNLEILNKRDEYFFLINSEITSCIKGCFYLKGKLVPISIAYSVGGVQIIKLVNNK